MIIDLTFRLIFDSLPLPEHLLEITCYPLPALVLLVIVEIILELQGVPSGVAVMVVLF